MCITCMSTSPQDLHYNLQQNSMLGVCTIHDGILYTKLYGISRFLSIHLLTFVPAFSSFAFSGVTFSGPAFSYPGNLVPVHFNILIALLHKIPPPQPPSIILFNKHELLLPVLILTLYFLSKLQTINTTELLLK